MQLPRWPGKSEKLVVLTAAMLLFCLLALAPLAMLILSVLASSPDAPLLSWLAAGKVPSLTWNSISVALWATGTALVLGLAPGLARSAVGRRLPGWLPFAVGRGLSVWRYRMCVSTPWLASSLPT